MEEKKRRRKGRAGRRDEVKKVQIQIYVHTNTNTNTNKNTKPNELRKGALEPLTNTNTNI